jgi:hypothetical protein
LLPYTTRVVSQRSGGRGDRDRDRDRDRVPRDEPPPRPDSLPPNAALRGEGPDGDTGAGADDVGDAGAVEEAAVDAVSENGEA